MFSDSVMRPGVGTVGAVMVEDSIAGDIEVTSLEVKMKIPAVLLF